MARVSTIILGSILPPALFLRLRTAETAAGTFLLHQWIIARASASEFAALLRPDLYSNTCECRRKKNHRKKYREQHGVHAGKGTKWGKCSINASFTCSSGAVGGQKGPGQAWSEDRE